MARSYLHMLMAGVMLMTASLFIGCDDTVTGNGDDNNTDKDNTTLTVTGNWTVDYHLLKRTDVAVQGSQSVTVVTDTTIMGSTADTIKISDTELIYATAAGSQTYSITRTDSTMDIGDFWLQETGISTSDPAEYSVAISGGKLLMNLRRTYSIMEPYGTWDITKTLEKYNFVLSPAR